jgi:zinc transport system ATP-binding protein
MEPLIDRAVVMRDGRNATSGPPLGAGDGHDHHHATGATHDHVPHVGSPFDGLGGGR